jgi:hypothetical protein
MRRLSLLATALTAALAACTMSSGGGAKTLHATLNGQQEVPPTTSQGTGNADFTLDTGTRQLSWKVSYGGLTGPAGAAHIHGPAAPGANAGVVVNLAPNGVGNPIEGSTTLTEAQVADLLAGKDYVNIHTAANKGGEIRGQIMP